MVQQYMNLNLLSSVAGHLDRVFFANPKIPARMAGLLYFVYNHVTVQRYRSFSMNHKAWQQFLKATEGQNAEDLKLWFEVLLTQAEQADIADRIRILEGLLEDKLPQRELSENLQVSISKITRGSNALKRMSPQKIKWLRALLLE